MPLPSTYMKVTMHFQSVDFAAKASCTLWYLPTSSIGSVTLSNIFTFANDFKTALSAATAAALSENAQCNAVVAKWVTGGNEFEGQNTNGTIDGTVTGGHLPEEDVLCIQRKTGKQGRTKRGRIFFPFVPASFVVDNQLTSTGRAAAQALAIMVKNVLTANGVSMTPHTLDHKNGVLEKVVQAGFVDTTCSRRDRRAPKQLSSTRV